MQYFPNGRNPDRRYKAHQQQVLRRTTHPSGAQSRLRSISEDASISTAIGTMSTIGIVPVSEPPHAVRFIVQSIQETAVMNRIQDGWALG